MAKILANSSAERDRVKGLLGKNVPSYRQAYSDRTAWIMACLSELAYIRFNPIFSGDKHKKYFFDKLSGLVDEKSEDDNKKSALMRLVSFAVYNPDEEKQKLGTELGTLKLEILETFDQNGTQAILVSNDSFIVLAFRGTEATSIKDIKVDLDSKTIPCKTGGKIHRGFDGAFEEVAKDIRDRINQDDCKTRPLFITGHSLGGALATVAAKRLSHKGGIAACYTFGSPRVGDGEWIADIKAPIYRVVNAADCVTMLPPGDELVTILSWIPRLVAWFRVPLVSGWSGSIGRWLLSNWDGYLHVGSMRYMTNCKSGQYDDVKLLYSVSFFRRIMGWWEKKKPWKKFLSDHSISIYRKKLMIIAESRN